MDDGVRSGRLGSVFVSDCCEGVVRFFNLDWGGWSEGFFFAYFFLVSSFGFLGGEGRGGRCS